MSIDYEAEYNNGRRHPEVATLAPEWARRSDRLRAGIKADVDLAYGPDPRHRYDIHWPADASDRTPIAVFIHGGYWQARDRKEFAFTAEGCLAHGVAWAMPSYRLAPAVRIADITSDIRMFLVALHQSTGRRAVVTGHSAGGHLAAAMLATDWSHIANAPADLVPAAYALSGVFELAPLLTTSYNAALRETAESAVAVSPRFGPLPPKDRWLTAAVGGAESGEFIRQSVDMAGHWSAAGIPAEAVIVPAANHFTILEDLTHPNSAMVHRIAHLARLATV
jgi:arylformamidase